MKRRARVIRWPKLPRATGFYLCGKDRCPCGSAREWWREWFVRPFCYRECEACGNFDVAPSTVRSTSTVKAL